MAAILIIWLVVVFIFGFLGYTIAKGKGREPMLWAIVCALLGLIGLVIILVLPDQDRGGRGRYTRGGYGGRDRSSRRGSGRDRSYGGRSRSPRAVPKPRSSRPRKNAASSVVSSASISGRAGARVRAGLLVAAPRWRSQSRSSQNRQYQSGTGMLPSSLSPRLPH